MNLMQPSGLAMVGLAQLFEMNRIAFENGENFPKSIKKNILGWIYSAKQSETRLKRVEETVSLASQNIRANQYNPLK